MKLLISLLIIFEKRGEKIIKCKSGSLFIIKIRNRYYNKKKLNAYKYFFFINSYLNIL